MVRFKNRWLLLSIALDPRAAQPTAASTSSALTSSALLKALRASILLHFGELGAGALASSSLSCRYCSSATCTAIVRCSRPAAERVRAACCLVSHVAGVRARLRVVHVGGTIRKVQERTIQLDRAKIAALVALRRRNEAQRRRSMPVVQMPPSSTPTMRPAPSVLAQGRSAATAVADRGVSSSPGLGMLEAAVEARAGSLELDDEARVQMERSKREVLAVKQ